MAAAAATASEDIVSLLKQRKAEVKDERKALDAEDKRLDRALTALDGTAPRRGRPALPAGPTSKGNAGPKANVKKVAKRKRRGGTRADQALAMIVEAGKDGVGASTIAKAMKIKPNYLYRVLGELEKQKLVKKDGKTYTALGAASEA